MKAIKGFREREENGVLQWYCQATEQWADYTQAEAIKRRRELAEQAAAPEDERDYLDYEAMY